MFCRIEKLDRECVLIEKPAGNGRPAFGYRLDEAEVRQDLGKRMETRSDAF